MKQALGLTFGIVTLSVIIAAFLIKNNPASHLPAVLSQKISQSTKYSYINPSFGFRFDYSPIYFLAESSDRTLLSLDHQILITSKIIDIRKEKPLLDYLRETCRENISGSICTQIDSQTVVTNIKGVTGSKYYMKEQLLNPANTRKPLIKIRGPYYVFPLHSPYSLLIYGSEEEGRQDKAARGVAEVIDSLTLTTDKNLFPPSIASRSSQLESTPKSSSSAE